MVSGMTSVQLVALGRGHQRQPDAGVAAGRLQDHGVLVDQAGRLGGLDHVQADAVLDAAAGVEELQLGNHVGVAAFGQAVDAHQRRVADELYDVVCDSCLSMTRSYLVSFVCPLLKPVGSGAERTVPQKLD